MFKITAAAAEQILTAAKQGGTEGMSLRIAAHQKSDGAIDYLMGFDEMKEDDISTVSHGVKLVMTPEYVPLLEQAVMDYVELEKGDFRFIFSNPKDANYSPPTQE